MRIMKPSQWHRLLLLGLALLLMGSHISSCPLLRMPSSTITCSTASVRVVPGTCTLITNPCADNLWLNLPHIDSFRLHDAPAGISVRTRGGVRQPTTREICAAADVAIFANQPVAFLYSRVRRSGFGEGIINITTGNPFSVAATATPPTINLGGSSQLLATPLGGVPPYTFAWVPVTSLNQSDIANPVASPTITTIYDVTVTDAIGLHATASVVVNVQRTLAVTASPSVILLGQSSQLNATASGGVPPYRFSWVPAETLSGAGTSNPIATPSTTTTYTVTATDGVGTSLSGSATVTVLRGTFLTVSRVGNGQVFRNPSGIPNCGADCKRYPDGTVVTLGPRPDPGWQFDSWGLDCAGTTFVQVTLDRDKTCQATFSLTAGGPVACFTYTNNIPSQQINLNASCSTGGVVRYEWDFSFEPGNPDLIRTTPIATWEYGFGANGTITLTVFDGGGASASTSLPFP